MGSAGFGVATGGDVSEEEEEFWDSPGPGARPRRSFAHEAGQIIGETQVGVVRGLWKKEAGYVFPVHTSEDKGTAQGVSRCSNLNMVGWMACGLMSGGSTRGAGMEEPWTTNPASILDCYCRRRRG